MIQSADISLTIPTESTVSVDSNCTLELDLRCGCSFLAAPLRSIDVSRRHLRAILTSSWLDFTRWGRLLTGPDLLCWLIVVIRSDSTNSTSATVTSCCDVYQNQSPHTRPITPLGRICTTQKVLAKFFISNCHNCSMLNVCSSWEATWSYYQ